MPVTQEVIDQQVIAATLSEAQSFINEADDQQWAGAYQANADHIEGLLETHVPQTPGISRRLNAIIGATLLTFAERKYGTDEMHPRLYGGHVETGVIATYHHAGHPRAVLDDMFRYAAVRNQREPGTFTASELLRFSVMASAHDIVMGNGRGNDERQSARVAAELMMGAAMTLAPDEQTVVAIEATTWDPAKQQQAVRASRGFLPSQQALCVADLMPLCDRRGPYMSLGLAAEDFCKLYRGRILTKEAAAAGISLVGASVETCMRLIDERGPLQTAFGQHLAGQGKFFTNYAPADPAVDEYFSGRPANITFMEQLHKDYKSGAITALGSLTRAREYMLANSAL